MNFKAAEELTKLFNGSAEAAKLKLSTAQIFLMASNGAEITIKAPFPALMAQYLTLFRDEAQPLFARSNIPSNKDRVPNPIHVTFEGKVQGANGEKEYGIIKACTLTFKDCTNEGQLSFDPAFAAQMGAKPSAVPTLNEFIMALERAGNHWKDFEIRETSNAFDESKKTKASFLRLVK